MSGAGRDPWNPAQYDRFREERRRPFRDLLALVERRPSMRVLDLGCGTGEPTRELHLELGARETLGIDRSEAMLETAATWDVPGLTLRTGTIEAAPLEPGWDLVFSNAALHWVEGHETLVPRLAALLGPGGQLAVQMPCNTGHVSHRTVVEVAGEEPFRSALGGWTFQTPVLSPEAYALLLHRAGFAAQHVRLAVYLHELEGPEGVFDWVKGTTMTVYLERLDPALWPAFLDRTRARLLERLPRDRPALYPFQRLLLWGRLREPR